MSPLNRRRMLGWTSAAVAGAAGIAGIAASAPRTSADQPPDTVDFHGEHQAGIITPAQERMHFAALDVTTDRRADLNDLLREWTRAAERMCLGAETAEGGALGGHPQAPPADTGEALDLPPTNLTLTVGLGASLFDGRFGLADRKPARLIDIPAFTGDKLDPARSGGDLCIQACADDPQVAVHAVRNLVRMGFGTTAVRWSQLGFGRSSTTSNNQPTPRNLFGFKDGTHNLKAEEPDLLHEHVWVAAGDGPAWMTGGSYLVSRRVRMHIETWDRAPLEEQQQIVGRTKGEGAPLSGHREFELANYSVMDPGGEPMIANDAHIKLASAEANNGAKILRRGYNFVDGSDGNGHLDAGLFFLAFMRDPGRQFVPIQRSLSSKDAMMEYVEHTSSALFAVPPGVRPGGYWADTLFA
jgi:deferrochelatase/peroxidase EfeB